MFGSFYSAALELLGKGFLVSAFVPTLVVFTLLTLSAAPDKVVRALTAWTAEELTDQAALAVLLLIALYLFAFILYGMRDQITRFIAGGHFWLFNGLRNARRRHFIATTLRQGGLRESLSRVLPNATVWAEMGFGPVEPRDVYMPQDPNPRRLRRQIHKRLERIAKAVRGGKLTAQVTTRWLDPLAELFIALHRHALCGDPRRQAAFVERLRQVCEKASPPIAIEDWCAALQDMTYGELADNYAERLWSPPLRHVQPTALGNVLIWTSIYTVKRYGIEIEFIYPRLLKVIDKEYEGKIGEKQQFLDFTVVLTFLAWSAGLIYLGVTLRHFAYALGFHWPVVEPFYNWSELAAGLRRLIEHWETGAKTGLILLGWFALGSLAYRLSLSAGSNSLAMLTSAVDLYRLKVLEALGIEKPSSDAAEIAVWKRLNRSIASGEPPASQNPGPKVSPSSVESTV